MTSTATPSPDLDTQPQQNVSPIPASRGRGAGKAGSLLQLTGWRLWVGPLPTEPLPEAALPALHLTPGTFPPRASRNPCLTQEGPLPMLGPHPEEPLSSSSTQAPSPSTHTLSLAATALGTKESFRTHNPREFSHWPPASTGAGDKVDAPLRKLPSPLHPKVCLMTPGKGLRLSCSGQTAPHQRSRGSWAGRPGWGERETLGVSWRDGRALAAMGPGQPSGMDPFAHIILQDLSDGISPQLFGIKVGDLRPQQSSYGF